MEGQNLVQFFHCLDLDRGIISYVRGVFEKGYLQGQGTIKYVNGDTFVGNFVDGLRQGQGKYTIITEKNFVECLFDKDQMPDLISFQFHAGNSEFLFKDISLVKIGRACVGKEC